MSLDKSHITIITPCYNEGEIITGFLTRMEDVLVCLPYSFCIVVVNDGSTDNTLALLKRFRFRSANICLHLLNLERNIGHQAAIYQGLLYAQALDCDRFIVMDSDGEDAPAAIPKLLMYGDAPIINVVRGKRRESILFRSFYKIYKVIFRMVTGKRMNFGNFCLIKRSVLERAVASSFTHFPAFLSKQTATAHSIIAEREERMGGQSKMGFKKLLHHAFKSFAEYRGDVQGNKRPIYETIIPEREINKVNYTG